MTSAGNKSSSAGEAAKAIGRPFKPGVSGNPSGRPKVVEEFRQRARKAVDEHVLGRWIQEVVQDGPEWMRASEMLAAYGYGKPSSAPEDLAAVREGGASLSVLTRDELLKIAKGEEP